MKQYIVTFLICALATTAYSQPCDCPSAFSFTVKKIEANYPGLKDKVTDKTRPAYQALIDSLRTAAGLPQNQQKQPCFTILNTYLRFFKDGHLSLGTVNTNAATENKDSIRTLYAKSPAINYSPEAFQTYLSTNTKN